MTRPPNDPMIDDDIDAPLHALYREGRRDDLPGPALDQQILGAAHAAVAVPPPRPVAPWWRVWRPVAPVLVAAVIGLAVTLTGVQHHELMEGQESASSDESVASAPSAAAARQATVTPSSPRHSAPADHVAPNIPQSPARLPAPVTTGNLADSSPAAQSTDVTAAEAPAATVKARVSAPAVALGAVGSTQAKTSAPEAAMMAGSGLAPAAAPVAPDSARAERVSPEISLDQSLESIRRLARAGQRAEALALARSLKARDPSRVLPKDIEDLLAAAP